MAMRMLRIAAALMFLSASLSLSAQRVGGTYAGGGGHAGGGAHANGGVHFNGGRASLSGGFHGGMHNGYHRRNFYPGYGYGYYWPVYGAYGGYWDAPWDYTDFGSDDQPSYPEQPSTTQAPIVVMQSSQPNPYVPAPSPKLQEIPQDGPARAAKNLPPALFVLANGERIETDRYMLSAKSLSVDVGRQQRTIPLSDLNIDATLAANQQRGLNLSIPRDSNSIVLGF